MPRTNLFRFGEEKSLSVILRSRVVCVVPWSSPPLNAEGLFPHLSKAQKNTRLFPLLAKELFCVSNVLETQGSWHRAASSEDEVDKRGRLKCIEFILYTSGDLFKKKKPTQNNYFG